MAKTKAEKKQLVEKYKTKLQNSKGVIVVRPSKLNPNETNEFRRDIYDVNADFNIVKNSIFKIALSELSLPELESLKGGEHAVLFMGEDIIAASKALKKFAEGTKNKEGDLKVEVIAGILDGQLLSKEQASELAEMPDKKGSIAMILGVLDQAMSGVVNVLEDAPRAYVSIIDQAFKSK